MAVLFLNSGVAGGLAAGPAGWLPWLLLGAGGVILVAVGVLLVREHRASKVRKQAVDDLAALRAQLLDVKKLAAAVAEDLDTRAVRLQALIEQADARLESRVGADASAQPGSVRQEQQPTDLSQRVHGLADKGLTPIQIARELGEPIGVVELALALRGQRG